MTWWRVWNKSGLQISVAISWAGFVQYHRTNMGPGEYWECDVAGLGWHDFSVIAANPNQTKPFKVSDDLRISPGWYNGGPVRLKDLYDRPAAVFPEGGDPYVTAGITASQETLTALAEVAWGERWGPDAWHRPGQLFVGLCTVSGDDPGITPVTAIGLYGPHGYNVEVAAAQFFATLTAENPRKPSLTVTRVVPLQVTYTNNTNNEIYVASAADDGGKAAPKKPE